MSKLLVLRFFTANSPRSDSELEELLAGSESDGAGSVSFSDMSKKGNNIHRVGNPSTGFAKSLIQFISIVESETEMLNHVR